MSQDSSNEAWLTQQGDLYVQQWSRAMMWSLAGIMLVCYDYALTLSREVQYIWGRRPTGALFVFYTVRYCGIISPLLLAYNSIAFSNVFAFNHTTLMLLRLMYELCSVVLTIASAVIGGILFFTTGLFAVLRAYAVSGKKVWVRALVVILGVLEPTISIFVVIYVITRKANLENTWIYYRTALFCLNIVAMALSRSYPDPLVTPVTLWLTVLTSILTSRFILDLQEANQSLSSCDTSYGDPLAAPDDHPLSPTWRRWCAKPASPEMEFQLNLETQNVNADEEASSISSAPV
ncbi:hypothetical protein C8Q78DRAFT_1073236 [Trametes maxima]|nr:hypothetical protein C8Q78DRAFT_1073236 [Trametes maxima]